MSDALTSRDVTAADHLPECPWPSKECSHTPMQDREPMFCMDCLTECICDRLRACEQRVNASNLTMWDRTQEQAQHLIDSGLGIAWKDGFKEGLDAARDAVARTCGHTKHQGGRSCAHDDALAAIDALREEQK